MKPLALWERFAWAAGTCFRCDRTGTEVAPIGTISARGIDVEIRACRACVFHLEQLHWSLVMRQQDGGQHSAAGGPGPDPVRSPETGAGPAVGMPRTGVGPSCGSEPDPSAPWWGHSAPPNVP
ncbi:hypothetical protein ACSNOF_01085 [Streptomyces sp. URMC 125]